MVEEFLLGMFFLMIKKMKGKVPFIFKFFIFKNNLGKFNFPVNKIVLKKGR